MSDILILLRAAIDARDAVTRAAAGVRIPDSEAFRDAFRALAKAAYGDPAGALSTAARGWVRAVCAVAGALAYTHDEAVAGELCAEEQFALTVARMLLTHAEQSRELKGTVR